MIYIQQLKKLRNNLANNRASVMVGAGFSKNVSLKFLAWDQLLHDLCYELYKEEIDREYYSFINSSFHRRKTKSQFVHQKVEELITRTGHLNIVTKYIERKGYAESIANYIEDRIPDVEVKEGKLCMTVGKESEELNLKKLDLHKSLLALPWNNVYTTNYDRLLEICVDPGLHDKLVKERNGLENEIVLLNNEELQYQDELDKLEAKKSQIQAFKNRDASLEKLYTEDDFANDDDLNKQISELEGKINKIKSKIRENEKLVRYKETALNDCFTVVKNASQLRIKRNKNIIKLHGSLRTKEEKLQRRFGFDGDPSTQYIIAKEHYDSYPKKHEAYMQLMRISLLQESFCLIGFSAVDPNFLAWIGWIRDLLFKHVSESEKADDFKIFLIDVNNSPTAEDKELFFTNHSIIRIPLLQQEIIQFLEAETLMHLNAQNKIASALKLFFQYLSNHEDVTPDVPALDLSYREKERGIWNGVTLHDFNKAIPPQFLEFAIKELKEIGSRIVVGDTHYAYNHNQHFLLSAADQMLSNQLREFPDSVEVFLELLLYAIEAENVPIKFALTKRVIDALLSCDKTAERTRALIERNLSLDPFRIVNDTTDSQSYDFILRRAFLFQFDQLRQALNEWQLSIEKLHLKAGFYALFDQNKAEDILTRQLEEGERLTGEQKLFSMELLSFIKQSNFQLHKLRFDKKLNRTIRQYEQSGFDRLTQHFEYYQDQLQPKLPKPVPYGKNRYSISSTITFKVHGNEETALQYLMLLVKSGFQLSFEHVHLIPADKWYPIFKTGFEYFPLPFIFYSLQQSGEDFLKRVGQDVAFSTVLETDLPAICRTLLRGYWSAPLYIQENAVSFISQLFVATPPEIWQDDFLRIWKSQLSNKRAFEDRYSYLHNFIVEGIKYVEEKSILLEFVQDCLQQVNNYSKQVIFYLYALNGNVHLKTISQNEIPNSLSQQLDVCVDLLPQLPETNMFVLGNLHALLSPEQISTIEKQLEAVDFSSVQNERIWHVFLYFANGKKELTHKIKSAIVAHPSLWFTGIKENSIERGAHSFLSLAAVTRYNKKHDSRGILWQKGELKLIYERMKSSLADIERIMKKGSDLISFGFELEEMKLFLDNFRIHLEDALDFKSIYEKVDVLYNKEREYNSLNEGLTSQDHKLIVWALSELSRSIELGNNNEDLLLIVLNRILFQMTAGLETCLAYIARWMEDKNNKSVFSNCISILEQILAKFKDHPADEIDVAFVEENLVRIAFALRSWAQESEIVNWWMNKAYASRYNSIQQYLLKQSEAYLSVS